MVYGLNVQETDTLYPQQHNGVQAFGQTYQVNDYCDVLDVTTAKVLGTYEQDFYAGTPAVTKNKLGQGAAYYLGARTGTDFLATIYQQLTTQLQLRPSLPISKATNAVSIQVREDAHTRTYFVINFSHQPTTITLTAPLTNAFDHQIVTGTQAIAGYGVQVWTATK